jgi:hypothetical protein
MVRLVRFAAVLVLAAGVGGLSAAQQPTRRDADSMEKKLSAIAERGVAPPARGQRTPLRTSFSERELNAYLRFHAGDELPDGVVDPAVSLVGDRRVTGAALVDLDAVRTSKERGWLDPAAYLTGTVQVRATGRLETADGRGTFQFESASVGSLPIPKALLQELLSHYSRSPELPDGLDLDKSFPLPANIREVEIQRGAATVIQ